ncbi:VIT1/CCC1 transporter family protein [Sporolactobacillus vineae]|uniref:VIT1/CCC1 transporter family protein n=1 Tax=Sporolactobacillus vineae TaxID=444463 RepID=UPI000287B578|nr:VIT family protein [Sporolactobacillus vineae]
MAEEQSGSKVNQKLNVLRAGVLGANDGIVSTAGIVLGVAGATTNSMTILISGLAGLLAGAFSMGGGEYVSVSTQKDTEKAMVDIEKAELRDDYNGEIKELAQIYTDQGLSPELSRRVAIDLMNKDALAAHSAAELGIRPGEYVSPWHAAFSSMFSFTVGAILPFLTIVLLPTPVRIQFTVLAVLAALALTGYVSAHLGEAPKGRAVLRNVVVGGLTMLVTYCVGTLF